jgi:putative hydrolase of the HAD superfamily
MYESIFFDFGGVITQSPFEAFNRYEIEKKLPQGLISSVNRRNPHQNAWAKLERAEITVEEFDLLFRQESSELGYQVSGLEILKLVFTPVRPKMMGLLASLKAKYKLACLTNNFPRSTTITQLIGKKRFESWDSALSLFDNVIESAKIGTRKPQKEFYEYACSVNSVSPSRVVFLDDIGMNLKPAKELGITTIKVMSGSQAIEDLQNTLSRNSA